MFFRAIIVYILVLILLVLLFGWLVQYSTTPSNAADDHIRMYHSSPDLDRWLRGLSQPDTGVSCCSLRDCLPTEAEWRDGEWWAIVMGEWTPIPHNKIVRASASIDGEAWVCHGVTGVIFCFVPPLQGY